MSEALREGDRVHVGRGDREWEIWQIGAGMADVVRTALVDGERVERRVVPVDSLRRVLS